MWILANMKSFRGERYGPTSSALLAVHVVNVGTNWLRVSFQFLSDFGELPQISIRIHLTELAAEFVLVWTPIKPPPWLNPGSVPQSKALFSFVNATHVNKKIFYR